MRIGLLATLLAVPLSLAHAAAGPDGADACVTPSRSTADEMAECLGGVRQAADARLNQTFQAALSSLPGTDQAALRDAQRAWLEFRAKDAASLTGDWRSRRNLSVRIDAAVADILAINARERQLRVYLPNPP